MPKETAYSLGSDAVVTDQPATQRIDGGASATDAPTPATDSASKVSVVRDTAAPGVFVVMHDSVSNWVKGCRVTIDTIFHHDNPYRVQSWERLVRLGAVKPESDPDAAAVPVAEPLSSPPPIMMAEAAGQLTVPMERK